MSRNELTDKGLRFKRLRATVRDCGLGDSVLYGLQRSLLYLTNGRISLHKYYLVAQPVAQQSLLPAHRAQSIRVTRILADDPLVSQLPRPPDVLEKRFQSGAECFVAASGPTVAGFLWLKNGDYVEDEVRCRFRPLPINHAVWDFDVEISPSHRSGFALAKLWDHVNEVLRSRGVRWSMSRISAFNPGSLNSHARLGAFPVGQALFLRIGRLQWVFSSSAPLGHLSSNDDTLPELTLSAASIKRYRRFRRFTRTVS